MKKRMFLMGLICLVVLAVLLNREGSLGPPFYTFDEYGDIHIKAASWIHSNDDEQLAAEFSCGNRHMSPVSATFYEPKNITVFDGFNIPLGPKWVHIICSP